MSNRLRRVDPVPRSPAGEDDHVAIARLKQAVLPIANVEQAPAPDVVILTSTPAGPVLAVRPYYHNAHYWQVDVDSTMAIREESAALCA